MDRPLVPHPSHPTRVQLGKLGALKVSSHFLTAGGLVYYLGSRTNPLTQTTTIASSCLFAFGLLSATYWLWLSGSTSLEPDYSNDPKTWFKYESKGSEKADLFYAHPTTHAGLARWNMEWEGMGEVCTGPVAGDPDLLRGQADAFSEEANVYAPKYRQMGFTAQGKDLETADAHLDDVKKSLDMACGDLEKAFEHFLNCRPDKSKPIIIAAHSQGAILMSRVLHTKLQGTVHEKQLVAAYLCGGYVPLDLFGPTSKLTTIKPCTGPDSTKCVIAYDTRTPEFKPESMNHIVGSFGLWAHHLHWLLHDRYCERLTGTDDVGKPRLQINPGTWTSKGGGEHLGVSLTSSMVKPPKGYEVGGKLVPPQGWGAKTTTNHYSVCIAEDVELWYAGASKHGNLHALDVQFWFYNIRENVKRRLAKWEERELQ